MLNTSVIHATDPLIPEPTSFDNDITIENLKAIHQQVLIVYGIRKHCQSS
jgi:hypothetical protein